MRPPMPTRPQAMQMLRLCMRQTQLHGTQRCIHLFSSQPMSATALSSVYRALWRNSCKSFLTSCRQGCSSCKSP